jgi:translation elongation factor EF-Tu-like GTPase
VRFLTTEAGGRRSPVFSSYRGQLHYDGGDWDAIWTFVERDQVAPGEVAEVRVWTVSPDVHRAKLHAGKSFEIR